MTKKKTLTFLTVLASLCVYLEWGHQEHTFLFSAEAGVLRKLFIDPMAVLHPFVVLPLAGQLMLIISLFQNMPRRWFSFTGLALLSLLPLFILMAGVLSLNYKIILSTIPFIACGIYLIRIIRQEKRGA